MRPERVDARERTKVEGLPVGDQRHGSRTGYNLGCRCPKCSEAHSAYIRVHYANSDRKGICIARLRELEHKENPFHGTITGYSYGCRCDRCKNAAKQHYTSPEVRIAAAKGFRARYAADPSLRLESKLRRRAWLCVDRLAKGYGKQTGWIDLLGCTYETLKQHIEGMFKPGMTWNNKSKAGWGPDHIKPCVCFDLSDEVQLRQCFHYTNLQPLWYHENLSKNSEWEGQMHRRNGNRIVNRKTLGDI